MERWLPVSGFEGLYEVSDEGRIRNACGRILRATRNGGRYFHVGLTRDGKQHVKKVHRLVALAFVPNLQGKPEVNHIDGNNINNAATNLEWVTSAENYAHAARLGKHSSETNPNRIQKLTPEMRHRIRERYAAGETIGDLSREYGVTWVNMQRAIQGRPPQKYVPRPGADRSPKARAAAKARRLAFLAQLQTPQEKHHE